jgi:hypothetical protein
MKRLPAVFAAFFLAAAGGHAMEATPQLRESIRSSAIGAVLPLDGMNPLTLPALEVHRALDGGRMVYSGSPEYCPGPGILYQDTFPAGTDVRLYVYHVNDSGRPLRFSVVAEPVSASALVAVKDGFVVGPWLDYFAVGRLSAFIQLGRPKPPKPRMLPLTGPAVVDADLDTRVVSPGKIQPLIHSIHDIRVENGPVRLSVVAVDAATPTLKQFSALRVLDRDTHHDRGTYAADAEDVTLARRYSTVDGVVHARMADGKEDPFTEGVDATTGLPGRYRGNYGLIYRIHLRLASPDGRSVALALNPRGGGLGGAIAWSTPRLGKSAHYAPSLSLGPIKSNKDIVLLGKWDPALTPDVTVYWTPPGSASLPVEFLLIPFETRDRVSP